MIRTRIMATGACVPEQIITNDDLAKVVDTSDEWISQRTGIRERRISAGENTSALAIGTAKQVIERAEISPEDVDLIIVAISDLSLLKLAEEGFGITILPRELAAEQLAAGRLKEVKLTDDTLERQYFIAYNEKKYLTGRMKEVLQVLKL